MQACALQTFTTPTGRTRCCILLHTYYAYTYMLSVYKNSLYTEFYILYAAVHTAHTYEHIHT